MASAPFHFVASAHTTDTLVLLRANAIHLVSPSDPSSTTTTTLSTSILVPQPTRPDQSDALKHVPSPRIAFPRIAAFSHSDRFLALTGDDKILRVFRVDLHPAASPRFSGLAPGKEVLLKPLPKRAAILRWLPPRHGSEVEELVVVDKFGDLRSFQVDPAAALAPPLQDDPVASASASASASEAVAVTDPTVTSTATAIDEQDDVDRPSDRSLQILLGHVSMITDIAFTPSPAPTSPPRYIITADRDEHIRISRWGVRRAAYVIERFLLGSASFVGALCIVPDPQAEAGRQYRLISSDGGRALRVWTLPEAEAEALPPPAATASSSSSRLASSQASCVAVNRIDDAVAQHVLVREREEKRREAWGYHPGGKKGKGAQKRKRPELGGNGAAAQEASANGEAHADAVVERDADDGEVPSPNVHDYSRETEPTLAITRLEPFQDAAGQAWLLFTVEGSHAFFHVALSAVLAPTGGEERPLASEVRSTVLPCPILDLCVQPTSDGSFAVWTTLDTRAEFVGPEHASAVPAGLARYVFSTSTGRFEEEARAEMPFRGGAASAEVEPVDAGMVAALALYPALTNWPKVEAPSAAEMLANRTQRKGRSRPGLAGEGEGEGEAEDATERGQGADGSIGDESRGGRMVKRIRDGRRARGREKNRAALGLDAE